MTYPDPLSDSVLLYHVHEWAMVPWTDGGTLEYGVRFFCIHCPDYYITED